MGVLIRNVSVPPQCFRSHGLVNPSAGISMCYPFHFSRLSKLLRFEQRDDVADISELNRTGFPGDGIT